ncbi:MAG: hypothetical protein IJQ34_01750 [Kiritimatiellae bacterium]|nr:hypothetical protein [Kiritimatiellia bacterium]
MHTKNKRSAQAMVELAIGMLVLALVLSAMFGFFSYIITSLDMRRTIRADAGREALGANGDLGGYSSAVSTNAIVEVEQLAADYIFGTRKINVKMEVHIPKLKGSIE